MEKLGSLRQMEMMVVTSRNSIKFWTVQVRCVYCLLVMIKFSVVMLFQFLISICINLEMLNLERPKFSVSL